MMKIVVLLAFLACAYAAKLEWNEVDSSYTFEQYLKHFGKSYSDAKEYQMRKSIFEENLSNILAHNQDSTKTWKQAVNHLADVTPQEFKRLRGYNKKQGYANKEKAQARMTPTHINVKPVEALPTSIDWRDMGVVTAVKDQGDCGSCWSFATAETLESHFALATNQLWDLSEQQILDCTSNPNNCGGTGGCEGGTVEVAYDSIIAMGGIMSEWTYPYLSHGGQDFKTCKFDNSTAPAATIAKYVNLASNEYLPLLTAIATIGPIAISVDASSWQFYSTGVYNGCNQTYPDLDHAVQLVGYGTEAGGDYWLVRNSWTPAWGEDGYIKLFRTSTVQCGTDITPGDGEGCTNGPKTVQVCGTCGILYDTLYPLIPSN